MSNTKVITGKVQFSYANVFEPRAAQEGAEPKYSVAVLIDKQDTKTIEKIEKAIEAATELGKAKFGNKIPKNLKTPLRDGDEEREDDPTYAGKFFVNCTSKNKPGIVGPDLEPLMSQDEFYSGCIGRASINFYAFNVSGNKGIGAGLNNLQKLEDGERLSGGPSAEEDFSSEEDMLG
jgi:hypothetical protein